LTEERDPFTDPSGRTCWMPPPAFPSCEGVFRCLGSRMSIGPFPSCWTHPSIRTTDEGNPIPPCRNATFNSGFLGVLLALDACLKTSAMASAGTAYRSRFVGVVPLQGDNQSYREHGPRLPLLAISHSLPGVADPSGIDDPQSSFSFRQPPGGILEAHGPTRWHPELDRPGVHSRGSQDQRWVPPEAGEPGERAANNLEEGALANQTGHAKAVRMPCLVITNLLG
jgi:hypothetical protein